jgi:hypothetical protein
MGGAAADPGRSPISDDPRGFVRDTIAYSDRIADRPDLASFHARLAARRLDHTGERLL